jgi:hypothetical protein
MLNLLNYFLMKKFYRKIFKFSTLLKSIDNKPYIFSRLVSVSIKPLILITCLYFNYEELGNLMAMIFLVSSINMTICSIPIFRNFLINYNNKSSLKKKYYTSRYKSEIIILIIISTFLILPVNIFLENSNKIFFCSILIFLVDKVYDEFQRFLIFKKDFKNWSKITNLKNFGILIFLLNPILNLNIIFLSFTYFFINNFKLYNYLNISFNFNIKKEIIKFYNSILKNKNIYLMNYFLVFYAIGDRIFVGKFFKDYLIEYTFLNQILTIPLQLILFFYIAKYKKEFVNNLITLKDAYNSKTFYYILMIYLILGFGILLFLKNLNFSNVFILYLFSIFIIKAFNLILNEVIYWKRFYKDFLLYELIFFIIFISLFYIIPNYNFVIDDFLLILLILFSSKFILKLSIFLNKNKTNGGN